MALRSTRRRFGLRLVVVFSLPLIALGLYLFGAATLDYHRIRQFDDWWSVATSVRKFGWLRARAAWNAPRASRIEQRLDPEDPAKGALALELDMAAWDRVARDVAGRWGEWIEAAIVDGAARHRARVRFRGDGSVHWTGPKKSLTVRTRRGEQYHGQRELILSVKDVLPQVVANGLGAAAGVLTPRTRLTPVYLNQRFYGLFRQVEPVDETFLRRRGLMPGNIHRGDTAERGEYFKDVPRELFANPAIWDRVAANDRPSASGSRALADFVAELNGTTLEQHQRLWRRLDRDELARMLALLLVAGDPYHMSGVHNQLWYEDPTSATLHPILWDLRLLELERPPPHSNVNRFWRAVLREPRLWRETMGLVAASLEPGGLFDRARALARENEALLADELAYERLREGVVSPVGSAAEVERVLDHNRAVLAGWVDDAATDVLVNGTNDGPTLIDVVARGRVASRLVAIEFEIDGEGGVPQVELLRGGAGFPWGGGQPIEGGLFRAGDHWRFEPVSPLELLPGCGGDGAELVPEPIGYRLVLTAGGERGEQPRVLAVQLENALTGEPLEPAGKPTTLPQGRSWHPWRWAQPVEETVVLQGDVHLTEDLVVYALVVVPGTRIRLEPDVSILARGRVEMRGTREQPIVLEAAQPGYPWGTLALQGPWAADSVFEHVTLTGGGCALLEGVEYKGMVSVHNVPSVSFEHCTFAENLRCDDALNVVRSYARISDCVFTDANADAIDLDLSATLVERCVIEGSGNDGIDLMSADARIVACTIRRSGDKGISVGEASRPLILDTLIEDCVTGIQSKDRCEPVLVRSRVTGCERGLHQFAKNWRYDGPGWARLVATQVEGNGVDYDGDDNAYLTTLGAVVGSVAPGSGIAAVDERQADVSWALETLGRAAGWRDGDPTAAGPQSGSSRELDGATYDDELVDATGGWTPGGGVLDLRGRRGGLAARIVDRPGRLTRPVAWDLAAQRRHLLVLEVAGDGVAELVVHARGVDGVAGGSEALRPEPAHFRYVAVELPPGRYEELALEPRLQGKSGRFLLKSWRLLELPPAQEDL